MVGGKARLPAAARFPINPQHSTIHPAALQQLGVVLAGGGFAEGEGFFAGGVL